MYMPSNTIDVKVVENAGTIILNRPDYGNALTRSMIHQLIEAVDDLYLEKKVRAIIITGAGDSFCTGADVGEMKTSQESEAAEEDWGADAADFRDLLVRMMEITKPIIAAVNGPAISAGAALVAACDIVVASAGATFGLPDVRHGMVAGLAAPLLAFRIGAGQTARLLLSGSLIDANEANRIGAFHLLTNEQLVWVRAMELAQECAAGAPEAMQLTKRLVNETLREELATQLAAGAVMAATARTTEAAEEGITALLEGRPPKWK